MRSIGTAVRESRGERVSTSVRVLTLLVRFLQLIWLELCWGVGGISGVRWVQGSLTEEHFEGDGVIAGG